MVRYYVVVFFCAVEFLVLLGISPVGASEGVAVPPLAVPAGVAQVLEQRFPLHVDELRLMERQVQRVAAHSIPATVGVVVGQGAGSGVLVSADGLVLTAAHVVGKADRRATVLLPDGRRLEGRTLGANHRIDAGMIRLDNPPFDLPYLPVAKVPPRIGEWVIATGQPGGNFNGRSAPVRLGRILSSDAEWVCTDCTLVGGDSGGPLLNMRGEVLAVHSSIGSLITHNFHTPVFEIAKSWERLAAGQVWGGHFEEVARSDLRPLIGIAGRTEDEHCLITQVFSGMPGDDAGMQAGDVVRAVDGVEVSRFGEVTHRVSAKRPGQKMRLELEREGEFLEVEIVLAGVQVREDHALASDPREEEKLR